MRFEFGIWANAMADTWQWIFKVKNQIRTNQTSVDHDLPCGRPHQFGSIVIKNLELEAFFDVFKPFWRAFLKVAILRRKGLFIYFIFFGENPT